jgi:hydrogenase nickel incorporation protein HypA/HybF
MHELGITNSILTTVREQATLHTGARVVAVGIELGELSGVSPDALTFSFESLVKGSDLDPLELRIENIPRRHHCPKCELEFKVVDFDTTCPQCGEQRTRFAGGDEINIIYMEIEE